MLRDKTAVGFSHFADAALVCICGRVNGAQQPISSKQLLLRCLLETLPDRTFAARCLGTNDADKVFFRCVCANVCCSNAINIET